MGSEKKKKKKKKKKKLSSMIQQGTILNRMTSRIRESLDLQAILDATVTEVRSFLTTDRVKIYKFDPDGNGLVIAESIYRERLPSLKGLYFPAGDIPPQARELFCKARVRSVVNLQKEEIKLTQPQSLPSTATGDLTVEQVRQQPLSKLLQRPVDPCHVEYLTLMGVKSSLVVPILHQQKLWGLLISHHSEPKIFENEDLQILQLITDQVEIAIAQATLLKNVHEKAQREAAINHVTSLLHLPQQQQEILQQVLTEIVKILTASGGRLSLADGEVDGDLLTCGFQPDFTQSQWLELLDNIDSPTVVNDLYQPTWLKPFLPGFRDTQIRGMLSIPLSYGSQYLGNLTVFRNQIDTEKLWAGYHLPDERQQRPRESFEQWREIKKNQPQPWTEGEIELCKSLASHLTMAVMQERLYRQEHRQRLLAEMRNRQLKIARSTAEEASRLKSDFLSSTSHELRTPLASTLNYLKLLKEEFYDNEEELKEYIEAAYLSTENLLAIINDILDIAKIEAGRMELNLETINLASLFEELQTLFKIESRNQNTKLIVDCAVEEVYVDLVKIKQILTNLLANAFKFTRGGEVYLKAVPLEENNEQSMIEISVTDTGIGVEPDQQKQIFEAFVQADGSIRRRYGGTGLGLTVCRKLVKLMGGEIYLTSAGKNQGTKVAFSVPGSLSNK